ncbi:MAG: hypothetical protein ABIO36_09320 [Pyrinomonadaceae bacterium]
MSAFEMRTIKETEASTILQRIAAKDKTAINDCLAAYGNFVWALAKNLTPSRGEAETVTEQIFTDIWQYCERPFNSQSSEKKVIAMIAVRRLLKSLHPPTQNFMINGDLLTNKGQ